MSTNDTSFNDSDSSFKSNSVNDNPSLLQLNAGSISNKLDELTCLIHTMDRKPVIIGITESWLNVNISDSELSISNDYSIFRNDRVTRGGGTCSFILNFLKPKLCSNLFTHDCESKHLNKSKFPSKKIIITS